MNSKALHRKMTTEILERIKDWSDDDLRSLIKAIEQQLYETPSTDQSGKKLGSMDAFDAWVGPETAEEIIGWIRDSRVETPEREPLD